jgi:phage shock protein C
MDELRKLYRNHTNRMLAGVCGGLGEYFNIDPTLIRALLSS